MSRNTNSLVNLKSFKNTTIKKSVFVAMSGGVDSSVAAALLQQQGFNVTGVYFKPWAPPSEGGREKIYCDWQLDRLDAMRVASILGIRFLTWDFSKQYGKAVAEYMIDTYRKGMTPNPDVMCNKEIKFGLFLKKALASGADFIATGHYAKTKDGRLYKAKDQNKDQTYFLWTLTPDQLRYTLFPLGGLLKSEVRKLAKTFRLPTAQKKDSQGVCFVGQLDMHDFLLEFIRPKPGKIIFNNKEIGTHDGTAYYTIGQRHGLNISIGGGPYYVVKKSSDTLYVDKTSPLSKTAEISEINWIRSISYPARMKVKVRYRTPEVSAQITRNGTLLFDRKVSAVTEGQSAVMYRGREVLGGAILRTSQQASELT